MKGRSPVFATGFLVGLLLAVQAGMPAPSRHIYPSTAGKHTGAVNAVAYDGEGRVFSAGADGFLGIWNIRDGRAEDRFQLSQYPLTSIALRPGKTQLALVESDGLGIWRISAWDYKKKQRLFTLSFRDPLLYITYSAGGNFIILARSAIAGVVFLHPETGGLLRSPENFSSPVSFAATGKSERTMISYSPVGTLSYREIESGEEIRRFTAPPNIITPILFGNNIFFGGFSNEALVILDAVSGNELIRDTDVPRGLLYPAGRERAEFICLTLETRHRILRYGISHTRKLEALGGRDVASEGVNASPLPVITSAVITGDAIVMGTAEGGIWSLSEDKYAQIFAFTEQLAVLEAGASEKHLGIITTGGFCGFIPLDLSDFSETEPISLKRSGAYTRIEADPSSDAFLFWQAEDSQTDPPVRIYPDGSRFALDKIPRQFSMRSAIILDGIALFLDSAGNITAASLDTGDILFSFFAAGAIDAAFLDRRNIVIGRSAVMGNTPFLKVDITNGETVPLAYPADIGARIYRGESGILYAAAVSRGPAGASTNIILLDPSNPAGSIQLAKYQGEDTAFSITESDGVPASTLGEDGAAIYNEVGAIHFERSAGLPRRLISSSKRFITVDAEGSIVWHDNKTGELLAILRFYAEEWMLEKKDGVIKRGPLLKD
ncbi:MAG: WD40 repeat domain-containing protein [Treponema sp.]|jgi:hypothetical protein|nr:WD40 repeat domain-containing protein [Treponema sp.]